MPVQLQSRSGVPPLTSASALPLSHATFPPHQLHRPACPKTCLIFAPFTSDLCPIGTPYTSPEQRSGYHTAQARRSVGTPHTLASLARRGLSNCARTTDLPLIFSQVRTALIKIPLSLSQCKASHSSRSHSRESRLHQGRPRPADTNNRIRGVVCAPLLNDGHLEPAASISTSLLSSP